MEREAERRRAEDHLMHLQTLSVVVNAAVGGGDAPLQSWSATLKGIMDAQAETPKDARKQALQALASVGLPISAHALPDQP
jgi:hypothetical protein